MNYRGDVEVPGVSTVNKERGPRSGGRAHTHAKKHGDTLRGL